MQFIDLKSQYQALQSDINHNIQKVLDHGRYIMGPEVSELESKLAAFTGTEHCVTVASGTEALLISLMALGVGPGDEVITTPFTFVATGEVIALVGATPVFVDIDLATCNIGHNKISEAITSRTKAIIPVSLYGQPADMDEINEIAKQHGDIPVIEDAAQSFGSELNGKKSCNLSTIGCTSFFPSKPLGCYGDGGALFTNDSQLAQAAREIRVHGQERRYHHTRIGVGGRMDTLQCAVVLAKLENFAWEVEQRRSIGDRYHELLKDLDGVNTLTVRNDRSSVWGQYTIRCDSREQVKEALSKADIPTAVHYPIPLHLQPAYREIAKVPQPLKNSELASTQVMSLPMHPYLSADDQNRIVSVIRTVV